VTPIVRITPSADRDLDRFAEYLRSYAVMIVRPCCALRLER